MILFGIITLLFAMFIYLYRRPTKHTHVQLNVPEPSIVEKIETLELENIKEKELEELEENVEELDEIVTKELAENVEELDEKENYD